MLTLCTDALLYWNCSFVLTKCLEKVPGNLHQNDLLQGEHFVEKRGVRPLRSLSFINPQFFNPFSVNEELQNNELDPDVN